MKSLLRWIAALAACMCVTAVDAQSVRPEVGKSLQQAADLLKAGKAKDALALFDQIAADEAAPRNVRQRATLMSELIRGSGDAS